MIFMKVFPINPQPWSGNAWKNHDPKHNNVRRIWLRVAVHFSQNTAPTKYIFKYSSLILSFAHISLNQNAHIPRKNVTQHFLRKRREFSHVGRMLHVQRQLYLGTKKIENLVEINLQEERERDSFVITARKYRLMRCTALLVLAELLFLMQQCPLL